MSDYKDYSNEEMDLLEQMQEEIEEQRGQISKLLNEKSKLASMVQDLKKKVQEQSDTIESLNKSDLQLQEAKEILKDAKEKKKEAELLNQQSKIIQNQSEKEVERVKDEYSDMVNKLRNREYEVSRKEREVYKRSRELDSEISKAAENKIYHKRTQLEDDTRKYKNMLLSEFKRMRLTHRSITFGSLIYGIFITGLLIFYSEAIKSEAIVFAKTLEDVITIVFNWLVRIGSYAAGLGDLIPHDTIAWVVHWILQIIVTGGAVIGIIILICRFIICVINIIKEKYADEYSLVVLLVELAVFVVFAEDLRKLPVNIILAFLVVFGMYVCIREVVSRKRLKI